MSGPEQELLDLIAQTRTKGLLLDSNLLLLLLAGRHDRRLLDSFERVKQFRPEELDLIAGIVNQYDRILTTPHILTEVNGLSGKIPSRVRYEYFGTFSDLITDLDEHVPAAAELREDKAFRRLGITDTAIKAVADTGCLVLSIDLDLVMAVLDQGGLAFNFNNVRLFV